MPVRVMLDSDSARELSDLTALVELKLGLNRRTARRLDPDIGADVVALVRQDATLMNALPPATPEPERGADAPTERDAAAAASPPGRLELAPLPVDAADDIHGAASAPADRPPA